MNYPLPPKWIMKFFECFCSEELKDAIEGDLIAQYGQKKAKALRIRQ